TKTPYRGHDYVSSMQRCSEAADLMTARMFACTIPRVLRVLHVISSLSSAGGGTTAAVVGMARAQAQADLRVSVIATFGDGHPPDSASQLRENGVNVILVGPFQGKLRTHPELIPSLDRAISDADVVHIHALWEEIQHRAARIAGSRGVPYIVTPHGMLDDWSLAQKRLKKTIYLLWRGNRNLRAASALHLTSRAERDNVARLNLNSTTIVEPLGIELSEFESLPGRGTFRSRHAKIADRKLVAFLGRVHPGKGLELLVPAMARSKVRDAVLLIIGPDSGGFRASVEAMVAAHGLSDRVIFTGMLVGADRVAALADADLFALPSFHENFGVAVIEALACGVAVVISDQVNIQQEIRDAGLGGVVPTRVDDVARELDRWLSDDVLRRGAASRAREFVWKNYDWRMIASHWAGHYARLAGKVA
ncbi:MAG: glycosyltransferase, partial [Tepidisphaeraceae bacterium]